MTSTSRTRHRLADLAGRLDDRDRLMASVARDLTGLLDADDLTEMCGGMSLHVWLQHTARCTHREARDLLAVADTLRTLPATSVGLADGWLSWSQAQALCAAARRLRVAQRPDLDRLIAHAMVAHRDWEPDALVADVWDWVDRRQPSRLEKEEAAAERGRFLTLAPRLFGGGSLYGELDPVGFSTVAEALDAPTGPPPAPDAQDRGWSGRAHGRRLADRLIDLCEADLAGSDDGGPARPMVLATLPAEALLDRNRTPGWLLHTLVGGRMRCSASTLQRLVDERGADLRTIVLDDTGQVVGVGRKTRIPPGWLREAIWARDTTVADPDRSTPVRRADLDHLTPWPHGATTVDNLQPLGRRWHNHKTTRTWTVTRARDGTTTWTHRRHGWTIRLAPPRRDLADPPDPGPPRLPLDDRVLQPA